MNKLLLNYLSPCIGKNYPNIKNLPNYNLFQRLDSIQKIRNYFFTEHNKKEIKKNNLIHLVLPYKIIEISNDQIKTQLAIDSTIEFPDSQIKKKFPKEKIPNAQLEDIIITHFLKPIDYLSKQEFKKYKDSFIL
jgi:hypothetical protein